MLKTLQRSCAVLLLWALAASGAWASAYDGQPKLVVVIIIDQFRGDLPLRYRDQFGQGGFRLFLDRGAYFTDCNYNYANTRTGPGHATLGTGSYTDGHGIMANDWWDATKRRKVTSVEDEATRLLGEGKGSGSSPHNLLAGTFGDELRLATQGRARVYGIALKDRAAILPTGYAANFAFWIDHDTGHWVSSSYYGDELPAWVEQFNTSGRAEKYWNREWKDAAGHALRSTARPQQKETGGAMATAGPSGFYDIVGMTPFANDYELEFARELITNEKLGAGASTDLLVVSLSAHDILGHKLGPDSPEEQAFVLATDRQLADFFSFLGRQVGMANLWIALSADHGVAPLPSYASTLRLPARNIDSVELRKQINSVISTKLGHNAEYVRDIEWPVAYLAQDAFAAASVKEEDAERMIGEALLGAGMIRYFTRAQLAEGEVPPTAMGLKYLHSYSPYGSWYVLGEPAPFVIGYKAGTDHATPYTYDTHVPLAFVGTPFVPGLYRTHCEPVDLAATITSLLGINAPTDAVGRVLTEALQPLPQLQRAPQRTVRPQ